MYCVQCGVKLPEGSKTCPLCQTPVLCVDMQHEEKTTCRYSDRYPDEDRHATLVTLCLTTVLMAITALICFIICIRTYHQVSWSGYVMLGLALLWIVFIFPFWFKKRSPLVFIPIDIAATCGLLLYICVYNKQHWFLSFGFPVTMLIGIFGLIAYVLFRYIKKGKLFIAGGLMIAIGAGCMLIELFQHITFQTEMFLWSLYCVGFFAVIGLFLIIAAMIPPLASYLERKFFI